MNLTPGATINVYFVDDVKIRSLNAQYLGRDYPTDVLSFRLDEKISPDCYYLGDVVISLPSAKRNADENNRDINQELAELTKHGVLHLLGVHHEGDE